MPKANKPTRRPSVASIPVPEAAPPAPEKPSFFGSAHSKWILSILIVGGLILTVREIQPLGYALLGCAALFQLLGSLKFRVRFQPVTVTRKPLFILLLLEAVFALVLAGFPSHGWLFPKLFANRFPHPWAWLTLTWVGTIFAARFLSEDPPPSENDVAPQTARRFTFWLLVFAFVFHWVNSYPPPASCWWDSFVFVTGARNVFDVKAIEHLFYLPVGNGLPPLTFWPFFFLWELFPKLSLMASQRLFSTFNYVLTIYFLYLAAKEASNKRAGMITAALALVSKPLLQLSLAFMPSPMIVAFILWLFLRTLKSPTLGRFIALGIAVSLSAYTYAPLRVLIPFYILASLAWLYWDRKNSVPAPPIIWVTSGITAAFFVGFFGYFTWYFAGNNWITRTVDILGAWFPCMLIVFFMFLLVRFFPYGSKEVQQSPLFGWMAATWFCILWCYPIFSHPFVQELLSRQIQDNKIQHQFIQTVRYLFEMPVMEGIRNDMALKGDSFLGFTEALLLALGLAMALARPNKTRLFLVLAFAAGCSPLVMTLNPHSLRLLGCIPPMLLLSGITLENIYRKLAPAGNAQRPVLVWGLAAIGLLSLWANYQRVVVQWSVGQLDKDAMIFRSAMEDLRQNRRVYIDEPYRSYTAAVLYQGHPVYSPRLNNNSIYLEPGQAPMDAVVYLDALANGPNGPYRQAISSAYPSATWETIWDQSPEKQPSIYRCLIPGSAIQNNPSPIFHFVPLQPTLWRRIVYPYLGGLKSEFITWEDQSGTPADPLPDDLQTVFGNVVRLDHDIQIRQKGTYILSYKTGRFMRCLVDGKELVQVTFPVTDKFREFPARDGQTSIKLKPGNHHIQVFVFAARPMVLPDLSLAPKGGTGQSLWSVFEY